MKYIGKLDKYKLGRYCDRIVTDEVILTDERIKHIQDKHFVDYEVIINNIPIVVRNPTEVLEDRKHEDTIFLLRRLSTNHLNVIVKLNTCNNTEHPKNSVMTAWIIRDKNLKKLRKGNKTLYKRE